MALRERQAEEVVPELQISVQGPHLRELSGEELKAALERTPAEMTEH